MSEGNEQTGKNWYDRKSELMEEMLGKEHNIVMHSVISYAAGGGLDLYYYPNGLAGTAIATKELSELLREGSSNDVFQCYELVMFTKLHIDLDSTRNKDTDFGRVHSFINSVLNRLGPYSTTATLNPNETCEFPADESPLDGHCVIFDGYPTYQHDVKAEFGLLLILEVFRSEMIFARDNGGSKVA